MVPVTTTRDLHGPSDEVKLVFHSTCVAEEHFINVMRAEKWDSALSSGSEWKRPGDEWRLPLYEYPDVLSHGLRRFLPLCLAEWTGSGGMDKQDAGATLLNEGSVPMLEFDQPSVTLWTPNVLLVTQGARTRLQCDESIYSLIEGAAEKLAGNLQDIADRALAGAAGDRQLARLVQGMDDALSWVVGVGFTAKGTVRAGGDAGLGARIIESPSELGPLKISVRELTTVVTPCDSEMREGTEEDFTTAFNDFVLLMSLQNVVWAVAINYDRLLLREIARKDVNVHQRRIRDVEEEGRALVSLIHDVASFRASLGSMEIHLKREPYAYWAYLNETWDFGAYLNSLSTKVDALSVLHDQVTAAVSSRRARRLGMAAFLFASLGIVTVGVDVLGFVGTDVDAVRFGVATGAALLVVLMLVAIGLFLWGYAEPGTRRPHVHLPHLLGTHSRSDRTVG